jgi:hypothetical protein
VEGEAELGIEVADRCLAHVIERLRSAHEDLPRCRTRPTLRSTRASAGSSSDHLTVGRASDRAWGHGRLTGRGQGRLRGRR